MIRVGLLSVVSLTPSLAAAASEVSGVPDRGSQAVVAVLLSALFDNVTTVILVAPIARQLARLHRMPVWPLFMPMIMAANIGGTATLIGDSPNILIGSAARLSFLDVLLNLGGAGGRDDDQRAACRGRPETGWILTT